MKGLGKRILVMAAVTAICVWAAGKSGYAVKPYRLDETELAQQVQTLKENNLTRFSGVTIYDGVVIGDTAYYVMTQEGIEQERFLGEMTAKRSWLGTWKFYSMCSGDSGIQLRYHRLRRTQFSAAERQGPGTAGRKGDAQLVWTDL